MKNALRLLLGVAALALAGLLFLYLHKGPVERIDWTRVNTDNIQLPKGFVLGFASAAFQVEGGHQATDSWGWWETQKDAQGKPHVREPAGQGNDDWNRYAQDIDTMKEAGANSYRFSLSWSKIEPQPGQFDEAALAHYDQVIDTLLAKGMAPMITLHHFHEPKWFFDKGAFDDEKNIPDFLRYVDLVFKRYGNRVALWGTFNEPNVGSYGKHMEMTYPHTQPSPDINRLGNMLKNILKAHDQAYALIKRSPQGDKAKVGLVLNYTQMDPLAWYDPADQLIAHYADKLFQGAVLDYFKTGTFDFRAMVVGADVSYSQPRRAPSLDFIGLNYYSHNVFDFQYSNLDVDKASLPLIAPGEKPTQLQYGFYPEGLYDAITRYADLKLPIYITENGIGLADQDEAYREQHMRSSFYNVAKALKNGYDVRAYYYWSLNDNFEWEFGYSKNFGLYKVDRRTLERKPKPAAAYFKRVAQTIP